MNKDPMSYVKGQIHKGQVGTCTKPRRLHSARGKPHLAWCVTRSPEERLEDWLPFRDEAGKGKFMYSSMNYH